MAGFWLTQLVIVALNILLVVLFVVANTDFCGSVFESQVDHALVGHVINKSDVADEFECNLKCLGNNSCKSFNIHPDGNKIKRICELNNKTRHMKPGQFKWKKGSTYYGSVQVSCIDVSHERKKQTKSGQCHPRYKGKKCEKPRRGLYSRHPAHSCKDIRDSGESKGDGEYRIDPEKSGNPLKVFCDMTTDGGGWLLIFNIVIEGSSPPTALGVETSYRGISSYNNNNMILVTTALNELRAHLSFTQLRFHCNKQTARTFHVTTVTNSAGEAVVQYFSRQTDVMPYACGSFARLKGDNSALAGDCAKWGKDNYGVYHVGRWGHQGMREFDQHPAFIRNYYHWTTSPDWNRWECDDYANTASPGDFWKIYVR